MPQVEAGGDARVGVLLALVAVVVDAVAEERGGDAVVAQFRRDEAARLALQRHLRQRDVQPQLAVVVAHACAFNHGLYVDALRGGRRFHGLARGIAEAQCQQQVCRHTGLRNMRRI
jgi:hypothetical protein